MDIRFMVMGFALILATGPAIAQASEATHPEEPQESVELPDIEVLGEKQELALRLIKFGLDNGRAHGYEGLDEMHCWFDSQVGSHLKYLYCAKNRHLNQAARYGSSLISGVKMVESLSYRNKIYRSRTHVNPTEIRQRMARLGPSSLNEEIVKRAMTGESLPDNVPSDNEVARFADALERVRKIRERAEEEDWTQQETEASLVEEINQAELSIKRYNEISDLVEKYASLRKLVKEHL